MLKAQIIGNIGSDPEQRYSQSGAATLRFNVASNGRRRDPSGNWIDETTWVRVMVFGNRAESLASLLKKGARVYVDGRLEARPWTAQDGSIRAGLELVANDVEFFSPRSSDGEPARQEQTDDSDLPF